MLGGDHVVSASAGLCLCVCTHVQIYTHRNAHRHTELHTQTQIHTYAPSYLYSNSTCPAARLIFLFRALEGQSYLREKGNDSHWDKKVHKCASSKWAIHLCDWKYNNHSLKRHLWWWLSKAQSPGSQAVAEAALPVLVPQPLSPPFPLGLCSTDLQMCTAIPPTSTSCSHHPLLISIFKIFSLK